MSDSARLAKLFSGYENIYGQYSTERAKRLESGKLDGAAWTERGSPNWQKHVAGQVGLGIIPLRINDTVLFAAIDVDQYKVDHLAIERKIRALGLPLVVCRSKSGGAHLYLFLAEETPAGDVIDLLTEWAAVLGFGGSEIFPKQRERASPNDIGNWINMPYFGGDLTERFAFIDGKTANLRKFLDYAESKVCRFRDLKRVAKTLERAPASELDEILKGAPPCLIKAATTEGGFPEGTRNDSMFNVGVFLRKKYPDTWETEIRDLNPHVCSPPLDDYEIRQLIKSLSRKETYEMRCNGPFCNKKTCRSAAFGRGPMHSDLGIDVGSVTKVEGDQATWYLEINDRRVRMDTKHLMSQGRFNERLVESINVITVPLPYARWIEFINQSILGNADVVQLPKEATWDGQFGYRFAQFCHSTGLRATTPEEVMLGKVFETHDGEVLFLPVALFEFLAECKFRYETPEQIWAALIDRKVKRDTLSFTGGSVEVWRLTKPQQIKPEIKVEQKRETF